MSNEPARYKRFLLPLLGVVLASSSMDGIVFVLLLQDIKVDLHLSDTQLGLLTGVAFTLCYSIMGVPIARWADRGNRVAIVAITAALWSAMMALYSFAGNFLQLFLIRVGVAVGEAGCGPPALSLISDHFTREERPRAFAKYNLGAPLACVVGYLATGWLNEALGWRMTFVLLGLPGLAAAGLVWLIIREPRLTNKKVTSSSNGSGEMTPSLKDVIRGLWSSATVRNLAAFQVLTTFFGSGAMSFLAAFMIRSYGLKTGELGTWFALIFGIPGALGTYWGGAWASRRAANNERRQLTVAAIVYSFLSVSSALVYLSSSPYITIAMLAFAGLAIAIPSAPLFATIQTIVPTHMRATSVAILGVLSTLLGSGFGPLAAGALSDALHPIFGEESLRYALLVFCPGYFIGGWFLWRASQTVAHDVEAAQKRCDGLSQTSTVAACTEEVLISR